MSKLRTPHNYKELENEVLLSDGNGVIWVSSIIMLFRFYRVFSTSVEL